MATIAELDRARIILDLVKDGEVANATPYANVDKASAALGNTFTELLHKKIGYQEAGEPIAFADMTAAQKGKMYVNWIRDVHKWVRLTETVEPAVVSARDTATAAAMAENDTDFGGNE